MLIIQGTGTVGGSFLAPSFGQTKEGGILNLRSSLIIVKENSAFQGHHIIQHQGNYRQPRPNNPYAACHGYRGGFGYSAYLSG
jgi:hypothetical protein